MVIAIVALLIVVLIACGWTARLVTREMHAARGERVRERTLDVMQLFAPGMAAASTNPRELLTWQPLAVAARSLFPAEFETLDRAVGGTFPFNRDTLQAAHSRWTADWLAWEQAHDAEFKLKAASATHDVEASGGTAVARARYDAVEREKLNLYQQRYAEYVRVAKALQGLLTP